MEKTKKFSLRIHSEIPLFLEVQDPNGRLKVVGEEGSPENGFRKIEIFSTSQIFDAGGKSKDLSHRTRIKISSYKDEKTQWRRYRQFCKGLLVSPLPKQLESLMVEERREKQTKEDSLFISSLLQKLSKRIYYLPGNPKVQGTRFPRPLHTIANTGVATKDEFLLLTVKLLRELEYKAHLAFSSQGLEAVLVELPGGKKQWINPYPSWSDPHGPYKSQYEYPYIFNDSNGGLEGETVSILKDGAWIEEKIAPSEASHIDQSYTFLFSHTSSKQPSKECVSVSFQGTERYEGDAAIAYYKNHFFTRDGDRILPEVTKSVLRTMLYSFNAKDIREDILDEIQYNPDDVKLTLPKEYREGILYPLYSNAQLANIAPILLGESCASSAVEMKLPNPHSMSMIWHPYEVKREGSFDFRGCCCGQRLGTFPLKKTYILKNVLVKDLKGVNVSLDSPWYAVTRKLTTYPNGDVYIQITSRLKKSFITKEEIQSEIYQVFAKALMRNFKHYRLILEVKKDAVTL